MLDISFSELMLIGVIALIVIGPEKLPKVARTAGHLLGRAQRYVNDVKTDIRKEMDAAEIGNLKDQMQEAAQSVKASVDDASKSFRAPLDEAEEALKQASDSVRTLAESASKLEDHNAKDEGSKGPETPASTVDNSDTSATSTVAGSPNSDQASGPVSDEDLEESEFIDTKTLPLPGFERERDAIVQAQSTPHAGNKGEKS